MLEEHIKVCQADGRYVEAMIANTRKEDLLKKYPQIILVKYYLFIYLIMWNEEIRRQEQVKMRHASKKAEIEEIQLKEFESFTKEYVFLFFFFLSLVIYLTFL